MNKRIMFLAIGVAVAFPLSGTFANATIAVKPTAEETATKRAEIQTRKEALKTTTEEKRAEIQTRKEELKAEMEELKTQKKQNREQWCQNVQTRIDTRVNRYENNQTMYQKVYSNMQTRLQKLSEMLAKKGANVTQLNTDLAKLGELIKKLDTDYTSFTTGLKETQSVTCGQSDGEFKKQLGEARNVLPLIKADSLAIKNFYQTTIKKDLQTIRQTIAAANPEEADDETEVETEGTQKTTKSSGFNSPNPNPALKQ